MPGRKFGHRERHYRHAKQLPVDCPRVEVTSAESVWAWVGRVRPTPTRSTARSIRSTARTCDLISRQLLNVQGQLLATPLHIGTDGASASACSGRCASGSMGGLDPP